MIRSITLSTIILTISAYYCHGLQSGVPFSPTDPKLHKITIAENDSNPSQPAQSIPLSYASSWPIWYIAPNGQSVTRVPDTSFNSHNDQDETNLGWVNPSAFEQLWLPLDLPPPTASAALGLVLKDGVPRYIFPTIETVLVSSADGGAWHNRGLNSLVIGKTWLPFQDVKKENLRFSCYHRLFSDQENEKEEEEEEKEEKEGGEWMPAFPMTEVKNAMSLLFDVIANGPDELGSGFCYLIAPLPTSSSASQPSFLNKEAVVPGQRVRCFLSDVTKMPTSLNPDDENAWMWRRGECDVTVHNVAPGGDSEYLPDVYKPLYDKQQCVE